MTLNLAHGRGRALLQTAARSPLWFRNNLDAVSEVLRREAADVVALQEAEQGSKWAGNFDHVRYLAKTAGYPYFSATPHAYLPGAWRYGTALLSRHELTKTEGYNFHHHGRWGKGFTLARIKLGTLLVTLASVHFDSIHRDRRMDQADELITRLLAISPPTIVLGDLNSSMRRCDSAASSVARALRLHTAELQGSPPTFPLTKRHIDWILASEPFVVRRQQVLVDDKLSDHRAVVADLALNEPVA